MKRRMKTELDIADLRSRIEKTMTEKGFTRRGLSLQAGLSATAIKDLINRVDNPGIATLHKIAGALDVSFDHLVGGSEVPLIGDVGIGGEILIFNNPEHEFELVSRPPNSYGDIVALRVLGNSMLPKYDPGDIIYIDRNHGDDPLKYKGRHCAVRLTDGKTYLKILSAGTVEGKFTLRSLNAADMENMEVVWASPVLFIEPYCSDH